MSSGLMSCVRENSPPLEMDENESGALSLPETSTTDAIAAAKSSSVSQAPASPGAMSANCESAASNVDVLQLKRRRFNPLRNLRRIFRRRTITSVNDSLTPPVVHSNTSVSEKPSPSTRSGLCDKNLRDSAANLSSSSPAPSASVSAAATPISVLAQQLLLDASYSESTALTKSRTTGASPPPTHRNVLLLSRSISPQPFQHHQKLQPPDYPNQLQLKLFAQQQQLSESSFDVMYLSGQSETAATTTNFYSLRYQQQQQQQQQQHHPQHASTYNMPSAFSSALMANASAISAQRSATLGAVAVLPGAFNAATALNHSFLAKRQKPKNLADCSQELDSSTNSSLGSGSRHVIAANVSAHSSGYGCGSAGAGEITDNQRSFSEGRLVDSDYGRDGLSQSHDSVFSESATASSLSIVLKAELADALRKRRNRPDVSDEDLGLPRSPASPQRRSSSSTAAHTSTPTAAGNHSEVSSLSMLSMNSNDGDLAFSDVLTSSITTTTQERSQISNLSNTRHSRFSILSSLPLPLPSNMPRPSNGSNGIKNDSFVEIDMISSDRQKLSHSAARHKMAIRPPKKKGPSRKHRRILETSIPEANEELFKMAGDHIFDLTNQDTEAKDPATKDTTELNNCYISNAKTDTDSLSKKETLVVCSSNNNNNNNNSNNISGNKTNTETVSIVSERPRLEKVDNTPAVSGSDNNNNKGSDRPLDVSFHTNSLGSRLHCSKSSPTVELSKEAVKISPHDEITSPGAAVQQPVPAVPAVTESAEESGFLHRLIQRNSKRTFSRAADAIDTTETQSVAKKLQIAASAYDTPRESAPIAPTLEKFLSVTGYDQSVTEHATREEIKREISCDSNSRLSALLSSIDTGEWRAKSNTNIYIKDSTSSSCKPKSGAAARQRYLPQEIPTNDTLERSTRNGHSKSLPMEAFSSTALSRSCNEETFQSTSIIRQITAAQCEPAAAKPEHHFEKKPKIIGLSSFQQKISRTSEACNQRSNSNLTVSSGSSIDVSGEAGSPFNYEQKQRKAVEKSRSFRTYNEDRENSSCSVHNNMPSLPDLSLQLPRFGEFILNDKEYSSPSPPDQSGQCSSLGFEINDNNLVRSTPRAESSNSLSPFCHTSTGPKNNVVMTGQNRSSTLSASKLLTPSATVLPNLSPTNSIAEIEQTIDMIVKSPFVSVLRKSTHFADEVAAVAKLSPGSAGVESASSVQRVTELESRTPPNGNQRISLNSAVAEPKNNGVGISSPTVVTITPAVARAASREKLSCNRLGNNNVTTETTTKKEPERKSCSSVSPAAATSASGYCKTNTFGRTRRAASIIESSTAENANPAVPEFLKIQLNRVDPGTRAAKSTVVLSKNARDTKESTERSVSTDDLSMRRFSNESIDIHEHEMPDSEKCSPMTCLFEAINKQTKSLSTSSIRHQMNELPPKSPSKKRQAPASGALPSPVNQTGVLASGAEKTQAPHSPSPTPTHEDTVILRQKAAVEPAETIANKISLQERKRLLMNEEKLKMDKKLEELKSERKKSINEELQRKSNGCKNEAGGEAIMLPAKEPVVVLRRKCNSSNHGNNTNPGSSSYNPAAANNNNNSNLHPQSIINKEDSTPELMKVFARRSLKIKDEDLVHLADKLLPASSAVTLRKTQSGQSNVDSDKENQSASEEKLDKLAPKFAETVETIEKITNNKIIITNIPKCSNETLSMPTTPTATATTSKRNSLVKNGATTPNSLALSNSNSNNNHSHHYQMTSNNANNNNNNNASNKNSLLPSIAMKTLPTKSYLNSCLHHQHHQGGRFNGGFRTISVIEQRNSCNDKKVHIVARGNSNGNGANGPNNSNLINEGLINNNNNSNHKHHSFNSTLKTGLEQRQSLCVLRAAIVGESGNGSSGSKTIERSATVSEFKGIHQRRAEWEQRAKEALK